MSDNEMSTQDREFLDLVNGEILKFFESAEEVIDLDPMNSYQRRLVHKLAGEYNLQSESAGERNERFVCLTKTEKSALPAAKIDIDEQVEKNKAEAPPARPSYRGRDRDGGRDGGRDNNRVGRNNTLGGYDTPSQNSANDDANGNVEPAEESRPAPTARPARPTQPTRSYSAAAKKPDQRAEQGPEQGPAAAEKEIPSEESAKAASKEPAPTSKSAASKSAAPVAAVEKSEAPTERPQSRPERERPPQRERPQRDAKSARGGRDSGPRSGGRESRPEVYPDQVFHVVPGTTVIIRSDGSFGIQLEGDNRGVITERTVKTKVFRIVKNRIVCPGDEDF